MTTVRTYVVVVQYRLKDDPPRLPKRMWETRVQAANPTEAGWRAAGEVEEEDRWAFGNEGTIVSISALRVG